MTDVSCSIKDFVNIHCPLVFFSTLQTETVEVYLYIDINLFPFFVANFTVCHSWVDTVEI